MKYSFSTTLQIVFYLICAIWVVWKWPYYYLDRIRPVSQPAAQSILEYTTGTVYSLYSPPSQSVELPIITSIGSAKKRIWLSVYVLTHAGLIDELRAAQKRGLDVRVLLEGNVYMQPQINTKAAKSLRMAKIPTTYVSHRGINFMHAKYILVDDDFWVGTGNFATTSFHKNREIYVYVQNHPVIRYLERLFLADSSGIAFHEAYSGVSVSPINSRATISAFLSGAKSSLLVFQQSLSDPEFILQFQQLAQRGVRIEVCLGDTQKVLSNTKTKQNLQEMSIKVRSPKSPYIHAKGMLRDDGMLFIGSTNFSTNAIENNRELALIFQDKKSSQVFLDAFNQECRGNRARKPR